MFKPTMTKPVPPRPEPSTDTAQVRRQAIDALLAEFNAVDEPFAAADLAPRRTATAADLLELDEPLPSFPEDDLSFDAALTSAATGGAPRASHATPSAPPPAGPEVAPPTALPELPPEQAEVLAGYMFEDEQGQEFRLDQARKTPAPSDLQDLLKSYLEEAS
jgi:hypothetical protein